MQHYSSATSGGGGAAPLAAIHPDIIETHILSRLDGPSLASVISTSPFLHALCTKEKFWAQLCNSTWASVSDSRVRHVISTFPAGHRSFFSDSFPILCHHHRPHPQNQYPPTTELISAVDIKYNNKFVYSKVMVTETVTNRFASSTFWVDLLDQKETVPIPLKFDVDEDTFLAHLEKHVTLSWILIDPTRKRSANVSSLRPVSVRRHWLTGEVQLRYATNMARGAKEHVQVRIGVTCVGVEGEDLQIREVNLQVQGMDDKFLSGRDSLVILQEGMEFGKRKRREKGGEKERYEEYLEMKRERRVTRMRREKRLDNVCNAIRVSIFLGLVFLFIWEKFVKV